MGLTSTLVTRARCRYNTRVQFEVEAVYQQFVFHWNYFHLFKTLCATTHKTGPKLIAKIETKLYHT